MNIQSRPLNSEEFTTEAQRTQRKQFCQPLIFLCALCVSVVTLLLTGGCMVGPDYRPPHPDMPSSYANPGAIPTTQAVAVPATQASQITPDAANLESWWRQFHDPELDALINRALRYNLDLKQAIARIQQARAQRGIIGSQLWPQLNADGSYSRSRAPGAQLLKSESDLWRGGFDATWELDIFGGVRRNIESAEASIGASQEDYRDVLVTLLAEVAQNYIQLRGTQQQIAIARTNLQAQQRTVDVTRRKLIGGVAAGLDVANAEASVASTAAEIPVFEIQAEQTIYALSVLLGQPPMTLEAELSLTGDIPPAPPVVPIGLPSELLQRRPDIRRAERQLAAQTAQIGVATADLFPQFSLTGSLGLESGSFHSLGNYTSRFWSIGPSVSWPIFDAGRIRSNIAVQNALQQQALLTYQQTVLAALQDVQNALVAFGKEQMHRKALMDAVEANQRAYRLATTLYQQGQTDFLNVLNAQRSLLASQDALAQSNRNLSMDLVALYKALGGGWESLEHSPATQPLNPPRGPAASEPAH